jgi:DNA-3-methyladenine glycosylase II
MFLLHHLQRPDIFPAADVGLLRAAQSAFALAERPTGPELAARAEPWRPFRSYAAALLWSHGLELRSLSAAPDRPSVVP